MKQIAMTLVALALAWAAPARAQDARELVITRAAARPSRVAPAENFTGTVRVQPLFDTTASTRAYGASVSFDAGARTSGRGTWSGSHPASSTGMAPHPRRR